MKKILNFLGTIALIGTSTTSLVACNKPTNNIPCEKENHGNWKQQCSSNKPFNTVDNKWYFVIWRGDKGHNWRISKFKFRNSQITNIDMYDKNIIQYSIRQGYNSGLMLVEQRDRGNVLNKRWEDDNKKDYFKSVYRWDGSVSQQKTPIIDQKTGEVTDWKEIKEDK